MQVVFCGTDYETKNGLLTLRIFSRLADRMKDSTFVYVGKIPEKDFNANRDLLQKIEYHSKLTREQVLSLFGRSHILFHPSKSESFGMVFLEASASGMAIVAPKGGRMSHIEEICDEGGSILLDRDAISGSEEESKFEGHLQALLDNPLKSKKDGLDELSKDYQGQIFNRAAKRAALPNILRCAGASQQRASHTLRHTIFR